MNKRKFLAIFTALSLMVTPMHAMAEEDTTPPTEDTTTPPTEDPTTPPAEDPTTPPAEEDPTTPPAEEDPTTPPAEEDPTTPPTEDPAPGAVCPPTDDDDEDEDEDEEDGDEDGEDGEDGEDDTTPPADDTTPPADDTTPPADDTTPPADDTTPPTEDDTTPPADDTTAARMMADKGGKAPSKNDKGGNAPSKNDKGGNTPSKNDKGGNAPSKSDKGTTTTAPAKSDKGSGKGSDKGSSKKVTFEEIEKKAEADKKAKEKQAEEIKKAAEKQAEAIKKAAEKGSAADKKAAEKKAEEIKKAAKKKAEQMKEQAKKNAEKAKKLKEYCGKKKGWSMKIQNMLKHLLVLNKQVGNIEKKLEELLAWAKANGSTTNLDALKQIEDALKASDEVEEAAPSDLVVLAEVQDQLNKTDEAVTTLEHALSLDATNTEVLKQLSEKHAKKGDTSVKVYVEGQKPNFDVVPVIKDGRTLVPLRAIGESLDAQVAWDNATRTITLTNEDGKVVTLQIDNKTAMVDGKSVTLDVPASIEGGRTLVPLRALGEIFGLDVAWDGNAKMAVLNEK